MERTRKQLIGGGVGLAVVAIGGGLLLADFAQTDNFSYYKQAHASSYQTADALLPPPPPVEAQPAPPPPPVVRVRAVPVVQEVVPVDMADEAQDEVTWSEEAPDEPEADQ